jgi:heptosyltransferase-2
VPLVLFNNIFNKAEFELYGRGEIVGPPTPCDCFYDAFCKTGRNCVREIKVELAFEAVIKNCKK